LKDINDFIRFWHCVKQPYCILTLSNSWHERFCFVLYLWEGRNKRYKATKNRKILMTTVPLGGLSEYTRRPIFVSASILKEPHAARQPHIADYWFWRTRVKPARNAKKNTTRVRQTPDLHNSPTTNSYNMELTCQPTTLQNNLVTFKILTPKRHQITLERWT
jgi:hypothetical protein